MREVVRACAVNTCLAQQSHYAMIGQTHIQTFYRWVHASLDSYMNCMSYLYRIIIELAGIPVLDALSYAGGGSSG